MKFDGPFLSSSGGQLAVVGAVLVLGVVAVRWQHGQRQAAPLPLARPSAPGALPRTFTREGVRFPQKTLPPMGGATRAAAPAPDKAPALPLTLFAAPEAPEGASVALRAPGSPCSARLLGPAGA